MGFIITSIVITVVIAGVIGYCAFRLLKHKGFGYALLVGLLVFGISLTALIGALSVIGSTHFRR